MILETSRKRMKIRLAMPRRSRRWRKGRCLPKGGLPLQKQGKPSPSLPGQQRLKPWLKSALQGNAAKLSQHSPPNRWDLAGMWSYFLRGLH